MFDVRLPEGNEGLTIEHNVEVVIQVSGKTRSRASMLGMRSRHEAVAQKIAATVRGLGAVRFDLKYSAGTLPHEAMMRSIELYGREVIPRVRALLGEAVPESAEQGKAASAR